MAAMQLIKENSSATYSAIRHNLLLFVPAMAVLFRLGIELDGMLVWCVLLSGSSLLFNAYLIYYIPKTEVQVLQRCRAWISIVHGVSIAAVFSVTAGIRGGVQRFEPGVFVLCFIIVSIYVFVFLIVSATILRVICAHLRSFVAPGQCCRCGYNLAGLSARRCPECGEEWDFGD
jgi:hypothetical protein